MCNQKDKTSDPQSGDLQWDCEAIAPLINLNLRMKWSALFVNIASISNTIDLNLTSLCIYRENQTNFANSKPIKAFPITFHLFNIEFCKRNQALCFNRSQQLTQLFLDAADCFGVSFFDEFDCLLTKSNCHALPTLSYQWLRLQGNRQANQTQLLVPLAQHRQHRASKFCRASIAPLAKLLASFL